MLHKGRAFERGIFSRMTRGLISDRQPSRGSCETRHSSAYTHRGPWSNRCRRSMVHGPNCLKVFVRANHAVEPNSPRDACSALNFEPCGSASMAAFLQKSIDMSSRKGGTSHEEQHLILSWVQSLASCPSNKRTGSTER